MWALNVHILGAHPAVWMHGSASGLANVAQVPAAGEGPT
jgi:hypothetical protein